MIPSCADGLSAVVPVGTTIPVVVLKSNNPVPCVVNVMSALVTMLPMLFVENSVLPVEVCKFCLDSDGIWKRLELQWMLEFFQNNEEYEKCEVLKKLIGEHFIADESKQNELNSKLDEYVSNINNGGE